MVLAVALDAFDGSKLAVFDAHALVIFQECKAVALGEFALALIRPDSLALLDLARLDALASGQLVEVFNVLARPGQHDRTAAIVGALAVPVADKPLFRVVGIGAHAHKAALRVGGNGLSGVAVCERMDGIPRPLVALPVDGGELRRAEFVFQRLERPARLDRLQLAVVANHHQLGPGLARVLDQARGQIAGKHPRLVDAEDGFRGQLVAPVVQRHQQGMHGLRLDARALLQTVSSLACEGCAAHLIARLLPCLAGGLHHGGFSGSGHALDQRNAILAAHVMQGGGLFVGQAVFLGEMIEAGGIDRVLPLATAGGRLIDHAPLHVLHLARCHADVAPVVGAQQYHVIPPDALRHSLVQLIAQPLVRLLADLAVQVAVGEGRLLIGQTVKHRRCQIGPFRVPGVALFDRPVQVADLGLLALAFQRGGGMAHVLGRLADLCRQFVLAALDQQRPRVVLAAGGIELVDSALVELVLHHLFPQRSVPLCGVFEARFELALLRIELPDLVSESALVQRLRSDEEMSVAVAVVALAGFRVGDVELIRLALQVAVAHGSRLMQ